MAIYSRVYTSTRYEDNVIGLIGLILDSQRPNGYFEPLWNPEADQWSKHDGLPYQDAYIMESLSFSSFQLRYLEEQDEAYYKAVEAVELCLDRNSDRMGGDGGWVLMYEDGGEYARLSENSAVLVALLYAALFEEFWGDPLKAEEYAYKAQKTMRWILNHQEFNEGSWGYGGFYSRDGDEQLLEDNVLAVYAVTAYLRIIISLTDEPNPSMDEARLSLRTWHDHYLVELIDEYRGPYHGKTMNKIRKYPMGVGSAGWAARALVEAWVVLGDRMFKTSADSMYKWMTGLNEDGMDMQVHGGFIEGYALKSQANRDQKLSTNSKALSGLIYCNWINLPEPYDENVPLISTELSCEVSSSKIKEGSSILVSGTLSPQIEEASIRLIYMRPDRTQVTRTVTVNPNGTFFDEFKPDYRDLPENAYIGMWKVSAEWEGDAVHKASFSMPVNFEIVEASFLEKMLTLLHSQVLWIGLILAIIVIITIFMITRAKRRSPSIE